MSKPPDRPHDLYFEGDLPPDPSRWADAGEIEHVQLLVDGFGDDHTWPKGWWGARIWLQETDHHRA